MASVALSSLRPAAPGTPELLYGLNATSLRGSCFPSFPRHDESKGSLSLSIDIPGKRGPWRTAASLFPFLKKKKKDTDALKEELLEAIASLDRGAEATEEDQKRVDQIARELESDNMIKEPLKSDLLSGKWELIYTTSSSILARQRPKLLRPNGKIYQAINSDTLRAQNMETWPFFNQVTANLVPLNARRVAVRFDTFKIAGLVTANLVPLNARCVAVRFDTFTIAHLIPIKAPGRGRGELEITYLDDELRISRGDKGNLFILKMVDRSYRVPT